MPGDTSPTALDLIPGALRCLLGADDAEDGLQAAIGHVREELGLTSLAICPGFKALEDRLLRSGQAPEQDWDPLRRFAIDEAEPGHLQSFAPGLATEAGWGVLPLRHPANGFLILQPLQAAPTASELHTLAEVLLLIYGHRRQELESSDSLNRVLAQTQEVILIAGPAPEFKILYVNRAFTEMTGYEPEDILGRNPRMLQGPKTERRVINRMRKALHQGEGITARAHNYRKDGSHYLLQWSISPIRDANGEIVQWLSFQRDVTAELEQQAAIVQQERSLTRRLEEHDEAFREELAGKLNDRVGQQLTLAKLQYERLRAMARHLPPDLRGDLWQELTNASESVDEAVHQLSSLARELAPGQLTTHGLEPALREYLTDLQADTDYRIHFEHEGKLNDVPPEVSQIIYRLLQDFVRLGLAHTNRAELTLRIVVRKKRVEVSLLLHAPNFPPASLTTYPLLLGIEDRLAYLGVDYSLSTTPKRGLALQAAFRPDQLASPARPDALPKG